MLKPCPDATGAHVAPFHRATENATTPPAELNHPPQNSVFPPAPGNPTSVRTGWLKAPGKDVHVLPFQLATPKVPPAWSFGPDPSSKLPSVWTVGGTPPNPMLVHEVPFHA